MVSGRLACSALVLAALAAGTLGATRADAAAPTSAPIYRLRPDPRMCPSPACGGFWASRVNSAATVCRGGGSRSACYVAGVGLGVFRADQQARVRQALAQDRALVAGAFVAYPSDPFPGLASLRAQSAWLAAGDGPTAGTVYRVVDTGIRCIRAPCFSFNATVVNGTRSLELSELTLAAAHLPPVGAERAEALLRKGGVLVTGEILRVTQPGWPEPGVRLSAAQVWLPA